MQPNLLWTPIVWWSSEFKDLAKFVEDTNSNVIGEELEDFLKISKEDIIVCRHSVLRQTASILPLSENYMILQKTTV